MTGFLSLLNHSNTEYKGNTVFLNSKIMKILVFFKILILISISFGRVVPTMKSIKRAGFVRQNVPYGPLDFLSDIGSYR